MSTPEPLYVVGCAAANMQQDGTCLAPVWMPYHQPVLPPLDLADGTIVAFAIISMWAIGVKARLVFRAARVGVY
ncbi:conserved hypothetical protein [Xanthomonas citri pv. fuscans]|nr:conserved hypothetical protein [Xanthomonas citri pv. fuscans]